METASSGPTNSVKRVLIITILLLDTKGIVREKLFNIQITRFLKIISSDSLFPINHVQNFGAYSQKQFTKNIVSYKS